jgi:hypothetical protein
MILEIERFDILLDFEEMSETVVVLMLWAQTDVDLCSKWWMVKMLGLETAWNRFNQTLPLMMLYKNSPQNPLTDEEWWWK